MSVQMLRDAFAFAMEKRRQRSRAAELYAIAKAFNDAHTYTRLDGQWMCPTCNKVHEKIGWTVFTGHQFPACCGFSEGHRLHHAEHATTGRTKKCR